MIAGRNSLSLRHSVILTAITLLIVAIMLAWLPGVSQAQARCPLPARLQVGDAVEVIGNRPNRLRTGPGLGYAVKNLTVAPGVVWYVQQGPVCANGINWYQVAAYDAEGWTAEGEPGAGYYLRRTDLQPSEGCYSDRLAVGMRVQVGDQQRQHVRARPSVNAPRTAWLYPGVPVTILDGPRCANSWVWWYVRDNSGRIQGWTSEGDGPTRPWLVPVEGDGSGGVTATPLPKTSAAGPTFTGNATTSRTLTPTNHMVVFSPDQEAVTVAFSDFTVYAPVGASQARRVESLTLPVRSGRSGYTAKATVLGVVDCSNGGRATLTLQVGTVARTITCRDAITNEVTVQAALSANAGLRIVITGQVWRAGAQQPSVTVDILDVGLAAR